MGRLFALARRPTPDRKALELGNAHGGILSGGPGDGRRAPQEAR